MGFPDSILAPGEHVEIKMHPHWRGIADNILMGLILLAIAIYVSWLTPDDSRGNTIQWIVVGVAVLLGIPLLIVPLLQWANTHYVITDRRVLVRKGVLTKSGKDITLSKITDVSFTRTLLDRILGSGTLNVESAGDSPNESFKAIPRSDKVQQLLNRLIEADATRRTERVLEAESVVAPRRERESEPRREPETPTPATESEPTSPPSATGP